MKRYLVIKTCRLVHHTKKKRKLSDCVDHKNINELCQTSVATVFPSRICQKGYITSHYSLCSMYSNPRRTKNAAGRHMTRDRSPITETVDHATVLKTWAPVTLRERENEWLVREINLLFILTRRTGVVTLRREIYRLISFPLIAFSCIKKRSDEIWAVNRVELGVNKWWQFYNIVVVFKFTFISDELFKEVRNNVMNVKVDFTKIDATRAS